MAYLNTPQSSGLGIGGRVYDAWNTYRAETRTRSLYRETVRELSDLSDRQLEDIGVSRHDIQRTAQDHSYVR